MVMIAINSGVTAQLYSTNTRLGAARAAWIGVARGKSVGDRSEQPQPSSVAEVQFGAGQNRDSFIHRSFRLHFLPVPNFEKLRWLGDSVGSFLVN